MNTGIITCFTHTAWRMLSSAARTIALAVVLVVLGAIPPASASTQPASIDCPGTQYYENDLGQCSAEVTLSDIVTVNGDSPLDITVTVNGTSIPSFSSPFAFLVGDNTVVIEASNGAGNDICTFTLSVSDVDGPIIDAPLSITLTNGLGQCYATIGGLSQITATDNCGTPTLSFSPYGVGDDVPVGTHTVMVTAEDENGNTSSTDFQLVVLDLEAPEIVAPASITFTNTPGLCDAVVGSLAQVVVTDNCSLLNVTFSPYGEGSIVSVGSHTITVTAEDLDGNVEMDTFELIIVDGEAPTITCPANLNFVTTSPAGVEAMFTPTTADNCGVLDYTCTPASGSTFAPGTNRVTCVVTDINGNTNACGFDVTVLLVSGEPNALNFDGVDDRVDATLKDALFGSVSTTIEFWAKAAPNFAFPIVIEGNQHNVTWGTTLAFAEFGGLNFQTGYPLDDCWHHFAFTYDGATGTMHAFVDGQPTPTPSHAGPWNVTGLTPSLTLGQRFDGTAYPWNGTLDELRIWNVQRTQAELQAGMFTELTGGEAGLVYYANFNQGVAGGDNTGVTTLVDLTANASHGTLSNFALSGGASDWVASGALRQYPEVDVKSGMVSIADGDTTPGISDGTDFGGVAMGTSVSHDFTIENTGPVVLNLTGVPDSVVVSGSTDFYVSAQPSTQVDSNGGTTTFTVQFAPNSSGLQTATISFTSDDCDEAPYEFTVSGTGVDVQSTAMDFDGVDDELVVKDFASLPVGNAARTIEFWVKVPTGFSSGTPVLWGNFSQLQGICGIMLLDAGGGQVTPSFRGHYADLASNRTFPVETWAHVALTADGTTLRFYVNGVAGASDTISLDTVRTAFHLGRPVPGPETDWFKGQLDEVRIWNVARTEAEISAGMNTELAGNESGLVCYYKMDDAMQPGVDCAAHSNVGCVSGATIDVESPIISNAACTGGGGVPDGNVRGNGLDIAYGDLTPDAADGTDFGNTRVGSGSLAHSFSIQNTGAGALRVSSIASTDPQFAISGISLPTTIADGDSVTFDITLTPAATGAVTGTIQIVLPNDCDECDYEFAVTGVGVADEPPTITCPPNVLTNALVGEASAQVSWMVAAAGAPAPTVTCRVEGSEIISPHFYPLGASTVTCTASNAAGSTNCSFTVTVNCTPTLVERAQQVADIWPGTEDSYPEDFIVFRGALYFTAEDELHGEELRRFDGTNVTLVRDLRPGSESSYPDEFVVWNDALYFQADDGAHGYELFKFDGTNVTLAADINSGSDDSYPDDFTVFNGALYFNANEPVGGTELWKFDGTNASRAADIWPGSDDSRPYGFTVFNGLLYFSAYEPAAGNELWKFDGTNATLAADIYPSGDSYPDRLTAGPDALYFIAEDGNTGREPWRFDGTNATLAADIEPGPGYSYAELLLSWNGALYFVAYSAAENYELWKLEGTNLTLVTDFNPGPDSSSPHNLTVSGNHLYFTGYPAGLYKYDGTNVTALPGAEYPDDLVEFQGGIYFEGYRSDVGYELFRTDGTNVFLVADIKPGMNSSYPYDLTEFNGALYFGAENSLGKELWRLNQRLECVTNAAPTITCPGDLFVTTSPTRCEGFVDFTNVVTGYPFPLFSCTVNGDPSYSFPTTLSVGDYTLVCTASNSFGATNCSFNVTVRDLAPPVLVCPPDLAVACDFYVPAPSFDGGSSEDGCDGAITPVLTAETTNGISPKVISRTWTATDSSGNSNSCVQRITVRMDFGLAADVRPGPFGSDPEEFAVFNGALYFSAEDNAHGEELWKFDGTNATLAADIRPGGNSSYPYSLAVFNNALYFQAGDGVHGYELWRFDGTNATLAADINPGDDDSYPEYLTVFNGALYFQAYENDHGEELWKFDGTNATLAADINSGDDDSDPEYLTVFNGALYFQANSDDYGYELWKFDGTNATLAADIYPGDDGSYPEHFTVFNGALYFRAYENDHGEELWKFDGTNATLAADIDPSGDSDPRYLTVFNGALYFRAYTSDYGRELWKFDGTNATLVADINPGGDYSYPEDLTVFNGALYFRAEDYIYGTELWRFDGTNAPQVHDLRPGIDSSYPEELIVFQGALYFQAEDNAHGDELWQLGRPGPACPTEGAPVLSCSNLVVMADSGRCIAYLDVRPFPNFFPVPELICTVNGEMIYGGREFPPGTSDVVCTATNIYGGDACEFTVTVIVPPDQFGVVDRFQIVGPVTPEYCCSVGYPFEVSRDPVGVVFDGRLFYASAGDDKGRELWSWDGTNAVRHTDLNAAGDANPHSLTVLGNYLYFSATDGANGYKPWRYDTTYGASQPGGVPVSDPEFLTVFDNDVFFSGIHGTNGRQIWRFHGDIFPEVETSIPGGSDLIVRDLTAFNNSLHFVAGLGTNAQLWRYDSTGSVQVTSITPGIDVTRSWVAVFGSALYFTADDGAHGVELWKYDGTNSVRVTDIASGPASSNPSWLTVFNGALYFTAENPTLGAELWRFDGVNASPVTDIRFGTDSSGPHSLKVSGNYLYFAALMRVYDFGFLDPEERLFRFDGQRLEFIDRSGGSSFMCRGKVLTGMAEFRSALYFRYSDDCQFLAQQQLARISQSFECRDDTYPYFDCPGDLAVAAVPGECGAWFVVPRPNEYGSSFPAADIICRSGATVFKTSHFFPVGVHPMTCTASNRYYVSGCSFTLTITAPLQIVCAGDLLTNVSATATSAVVSFAVSASGECSPLISTNCVPPSGSEFPPGTTTVTCVVSNAGGLTASCSFNVTVAPNHPPRFACDQPVLRLNGSDGRVRVPGFGNLAPTEEITIEFWQKVNAAVVQATFVLDPDDGYNRINAHVPWDDGTLYWDFGDSGNDGRSSYYLASEAIATWQHFALVSSRSDNKMRVYRNGLLEHEENHAGIFNRVASDLILGGKDVPFGGLLAEFRVWQGARSGADIAAHYQRRLTGAEAGLVAYYPLNETNGPTAYDLSTNANHGTLEGGADWILSDLPIACPPTLLVLTSCMSTNPAAGSITNLVSDADGQAITVVWFLDGTPVRTNDVPASGPPSLGAVTLDAVFTLGQHTVVATATDLFGDSTSMTNLVNVIEADTVPPVITCPTNLLVVAPPGATSAVANYPVTATDSCDTNPVVVCDPPSGSLLPFGVTSVNCWAIDNSGNSNSCSFTATVCGMLITVANTDDSGAGSLRSAIANACPGAIITFDPALYGQTIVLSTVGYNAFGPSALSITSSVTIVGPTGDRGITLAGPGGGANLRAFHVGPTGSLTLQNLTLRDFASLGDAGSPGSTSGAGGGGGGGAGAGGAVFNEGLLVVQSCTLHDNQAVGGAGGHGFDNGGGSEGTGGNGGGPAGGAGGYASASGGAGGFLSGGGGGGGAGANPGAGGAGGFGGGGGGSGGATFGGSGPSGGTVIFGGGAGGQSDYSAAAGGGGGAGLGGAIFNQAGTVTIVNSTLADNSVLGGVQGGGAYEAVGHTAGTPGQGLGGAIFSRNGTVNFTNSTVSGNSAPEGGRGLFLVSDGSGSQAIAAIYNSILGQADAAVSDFGTRTINSATEPASDGANNLIRNPGTFGGASSNADPLLAPLQFNGGSTPTLAPAANGPAINTGNNAFAAGLPNDQRGPGFARVFGGTTDIGALESQAGVPELVCPADLTTNTTAGANTAVVDYPAPEVFGSPTPVVACVPASGAPFGLGTNLVTCTATNALGTNFCGFAVIVLDLEPPVIDCTNLVVNAGTDCMAVVNYSVTATDNDRVVSTNCVPPFGSSFALGTNTVTCTAIDAGGNTNACSFTVTVRDVTPPVIACSPNLSHAAAAGATSTNLNYTTTATDNCTVASTNCSPASGSAFPLGATTVNCLATDASGNTNGCSFTVTVCSPLVTVVNTNDSGPGSLRQAIADLCPGGTITFDTNGVFATPQTIGLTSGDLVIAKGLSIVGPGTNVLSISGNNASRIFQINGNPANPITNTISGLTLREGNGSGSVTNTLGGAIYSFGATLTLDHCAFSSNSAVFYGGGIYAKLGSVALTHCTFSSNTAYTGGGIFAVSNIVTLTQCALSGNSATGFDAYGGGIYTEFSTVEFRDSAVSGNSAIGGGGVGFGSGGGICTIRGDLALSNSSVTGNVANHSGGGIYYSDNSDHSLTLTQCSITGNSARDGGGISAFGGIATLTRCQVSGNSASYGGGIRGQALTLTESTVSGNSAVEEGGGIHSSFVALTQCTVSGNRATNSYGGGIFSYDAVILTHCTVSGNSATFGGGILSSFVALNNSIVAGNFAGTTSDDIYGDPSAISGAYNLIGDAATSGGLTNGVNGNIVGNAGVGTFPITSILNTNLADNGGPTLTHALVPGSPAINAGDPAFTPPPDFDQRGPGFPRVVCSTVDIGAVEFPAQPADLVVTSLADSGPGTLREAIFLANACLDTNTITFATNGIITLTTGELGIAGPVNILGPGPTNLAVNGNYPITTNRVFQINSNITVTIAGLTITNGYSERNFGGGGILNNHATLTVSNCTVSGNSAGNRGGGGIWNDGQLGNATLHIINSTFSGNSAENSGGGIQNYGLDGSATLTIVNSTFSGNSAAPSGGAIWNYAGDFGTATLEIIHSTFNGDTATFGGGIAMYKASLTMGNTILNSASGGNINNLNGTVTSLGYNLISDGGGFSTTTGDQTNTNPLLGPLTNNGGPTLTHALLPGSQAINMGSLTLNTPVTDQRGVSRPQGKGVDIGAFEFEVAAFTNLTLLVNPATNNAAAVAELINALNVAGTAASNATIHLVTNGTYLLSATNNYWYGPNALPPICSAVTLEGNGATLQVASNLTRLRFFYVGADPARLATSNYHTPGAGQLTLRDLTLRGGRQKGGDSSGGSGAGMGGAIFNQSVVMLDSVTLTDNRATGGNVSGSGLGISGGGMGQDAPANNSGGGFGGAVSPPGSSGGNGSSAGGGGGGGGFATSSNGANAPSDAGGNGGGTPDGLGGRGGFGGGASGYGSGGGGGGGDGAAGGAFGGGGGGGLFVGTGGAGGVGGGGGFAEVSNGGGGFGGGGCFGGGGGGFGGGCILASGGQGFGGSGRGGGGGFGGAVFNHGGCLYVTNSTLALNSANGGAAVTSGSGASGLGGAIFNLNGQVALTSSTLASNSVATGPNPDVKAFAAGGALYSLGYNAAVAVTAQVALANCILANNPGGPDVSNNGHTNLITEGLNNLTNIASAQLIYSGANLVTAQTNLNGGTVNNAPTVTANPLLGPLANNGGPTFTMALLSSSPAINAGDPAFDTNSLAFDQRGSGFPRVSNGRVDIGAFESQGIPLPEIVLQHPAGVDLVDGVGVMDFGSVNLGSNVVRTLIISNAGAAELTGLALSKSGPHSGDFILSPLATNVLAPSASLTVNVTFQPGAACARLGFIHVASNDSDENRFDVGLIGIGGSAGFVRGVNLGGAAVTIEGQPWLSDAQAQANGLSMVNARADCVTLTCLSNLNANTRAMFECVRWRSGPPNGQGFTLHQIVPNGSYQVYLWMVENFQNNYRSMNVRLEGVQVATNIGDLLRCETRKYGPYSASVTDGVLTLEILRATKGDPNLMGLLIVGDCAAQPPAVALTEPIDGTHLLAGTGLDLGAMAVVPTGTVSRVEFYDGASLLGSDTNAPYDYHWASVPEGVHLLTAVAIDSAGARGTSATVTLTATNLPGPVVMLTSPTNGTSLLAGTNLMIEATASAFTTRSVTQVTFYAGASLLGADTVAPFTYDWASVPAGVQLLTAVAIDNAGARGTSAPVSLTATNVPATNSFSLGINLAGNAVTIESNLWKSFAQALASGLTVAQGSTGAVNFNFPTVPAADADTLAMLQDVVWRSGPPNGQGFTLSQTVSNGSYDVYLWMVENFQNNYRNVNVRLEGWQVATNLGDLPRGHWRRYGPYTANVADGALTLEILRGTKGDPSLCGLFIVGTGALVPPPVNTPPVVALTNPPSGSAMLAGGSVNLQASASDSGGSVTNVEFFDGASKLGEDNAAPYSYLWAGVPAGLRSLTAVATDNAGARATSAVVSLNVTNAPAPPAAVLGINLAGNAVTIEGNLWRSHAQALSSGLTVAQGITGSVNFTFPIVPGTNADTLAMLQGVVWRSGPPNGQGFTLNQTVSNGSYDVYLWMVENFQSNYRNMNVRLEGAQVASNLGDLPRGHWRKYGPFSTTVSDGSLTIDILRATKGDPSLCGLLIVPRSGPVSPSPSPVVKEPWLEVARVADGGVVLRLHGQPGWNYAIESSADLQNWTPWRTQRLDEDVVELEEIPASASQQQFYRARVEP